MQLPWMIYRDDACCSGDGHLHDPDGSLHAGSGDGHVRDPDGSLNAGSGDGRLNDPDDDEA